MQPAVASPSLLDKATRLWRAARKHRWLALGVAALALFFCALVIRVVPDRYKASAQVYVDTDTVLKPLMAGLTFQPDIDQQLQMLARTLVSRANVERLVQLPALHFEADGAAAHEALVTRLMNDIKVVPTGAGNLFEISYRGDSPERAQRLVEATLELFTHAGPNAKKRDAEDANRFIEERISAYDAQLREAENRLKEFKVRHFGVSGQSNEDFFTRMSGLTEEVNKLRLQLNSALQSRDAYRRELALEEELPPELAPRTHGPALQDAISRLDAQKKHLDELRNRFTESHPEVIATRDVVATMEADVRQRREAEERTLAKFGKSAKGGAGPAYQRLRTLLAEAEAQVASLRSQLEVRQAALERVRALAGRMPQVEAEFSQLNRDYDVIRKSYDQMVARRESAKLGEKLDESSRLAEFRVIAPPTVSRWPVFPSKVYLALLTLLLAPAAGLAAAYVADRVRPTVDDEKSLRMVSGRPVLGTVSWGPTGKVRRRQQVVTIGFAAAALALFTLQASWVASIVARLATGWTTS
jgi:polysaccharide chain length determinant protein (PEP-CTERM system associated)